MYSNIQILRYRDIAVHGPEISSQLLSMVLKLPNSTAVLCDIMHFGQCCVRVGCQLLLPVSKIYGMEISS